MTRRRIRFSLGTKFLGLFLLVVVSISSGAGWYFFDRSRRSIAEQLEQRAHTIAWTLSFNCRYAVLTADRHVLEDLTEETLRNEDVVHVRIEDGRGNLLIERWKEGYKQGAEGLDPASGSILEVEAPVDPASSSGAVRVDPDVEAVFGIGGAAGGEGRGLVHLGLSRAGMEEGLAKALRSSLALFAAATGLGIAVMLLFLHYIVTPIHRLSERLARVTAGDLSSRLPEDRTDEIGQLARSFNAMAEGLQNSRAAMREAQEALLESSRLAAVGEVAGHAAHEILNPLSAVYGRLENERHHMTTLCVPMLQVFEQIVNGWSQEYRGGGWEGLARSLRRPVSGPAGAIPLLEEDLENLRRIATGLRGFQVERSHDLDLLLREVERVTRIVDGMRSMSRAGAHPEELRVEQIIADSVEILRDPLEKRGIQVEVEGPEKPTLVLADRDELVQIFTNLIRNSMQAIDAARSRGEGLISVGVKTRDGLAEVSVRDNGSGIPPEHQSRIFDAAFTSKGPKEGTGLGLGICRRLARGARGDVRLGGSAPGQGTTIVVELPRMETR